MNCRPGDLAFVVGTSFPANHDRIVKVIRRAIDMPDGRPAWVVYSEGSPLYGVISRGSRLNEPATAHAARCPDENLRPLRGDLSGDESPTEQGTPAPATTQEGATA